jgi:two-component system, LuxR family, response regulator FixJ
MLEQTISRGEVYVVDEDATARGALSAALCGAGYGVIFFADGAALLAETRVRAPACILLEARLFDGSWLELLRKLRSENCPAPIFIASAYGDIPMAVDAVRNGAYDFIEKPFHQADIVARLDAATGEAVPDNVDSDAQALLQQLSEQRLLTPRERDVVAGIAMGETNKETARRLGLSARTIEGYRSNLRRKVGARNAAQLVRRFLDPNR